jgi:hypothetical protein
LANRAGSTSALIIVCCALLMLSCDTAERTLPGSTGRSGELLVIIDTTYWKGKLGQEIRRCLAGTQPGLPQHEPHYRLIQAPPNGGAPVFKRTAKILFVEIDKTSKPTFAHEENVWAQDQYYVKIQAPSTNDAIRIMAVNCEALLSLFKKAELNRLGKATAKAANATLGKQIKEKVGVKMDVPKGFKRVKEGENYTYYRRDRKIGEHSVIQGLLIYTTPYTDVAQLTGMELLKKRNVITKKAVEGSEKGIFMEVYNDYPVDTAVISHNGNFMKEMRGLWRMNGQFMGGPFVNLALVDTVHSKIISVDGFVYAPKFDKRDYIREMEAIARSLAL